MKLNNLEWKHLLLSVCMLLLFGFSNAEVYEHSGVRTGQDAEAIIPQAEMVRIDLTKGEISFVRFKEGSGVTRTNFFDLLQPYLYQGDGVTYELIQEQMDDYSFTPLLLSAAVL